ncbi:MAG: GTPase HflX [Proteobacteria bacterium]|nr:GTPase HflX [Pseudomonadota bacterium]
MEKHQNNNIEETANQRRTVSVVIHNGRLAAEEQREEIEEINQLTATATLDVLATPLFKVVKPHPAHYIGAGAVETLTEVLQRFQARQVVFNCNLSVTQARNLEKQLAMPVIDRTDLILDIFSRRAKSHEGKMQVQLAHSRRQLSRLAGFWTHLERQRGGIGVRGGPGEKQIELDRRMLAQKISRLEAQISKMTQRKKLARQRRRKNGIMTAALVGYTNAGKSSLFNLLARENAVSDDRLFVTLDSTARRVRSADGQHFVLSDTVGFIRNLPHELVAGFRATLADTVDSDLLLIVVDVSRHDWQEHLQLVQEVLAEIGAEEQRRIIVYNKIDQNGQDAKIEFSECGTMQVVYMSCHTRAGLPLLQQLVATAAAKHMSLFEKPPK